MTRRAKAGWLITGVAGFILSAGIGLGYSAKYMMDHGVSLRVAENWNAIIMLWGSFVVLGIIILSLSIILVKEGK